MRLQDDRMTLPSAELELADWRRQVSELYASVRAEPDPERGHAVWRAGRGDLFVNHPQSPLDLATRCDGPGCGTGRTNPPSASSYVCSRCRGSQPSSQRTGEEPTTLRAIGRVESLTR